MKVSMKTRQGEPYLLHWKKNPTTWNESLEELKKRPNVVRRNKQWYTIVFAHYTGTFDIVDCTCNGKGDFYPINTSLLKEL